MRKYTAEDWQQKLNALNQPLVIISKRNEPSKDEIFSIQCYKCGGVFDADRKNLHSACINREKSSQMGNWCPYCNGKQIIKGVTDIATLRPDLVKYFVNKKDTTEYGQGSSKRVELICPKCKQTKTLRIADLCRYGFHCDYCSDNVSLGEKIIRNLMVQLPIEEYDFEYTDTWTQSKRYDVMFVYQDIKYLIEVDGEQHIKNTSWSTKDWQSKNDEFKTELAKDNGFELIRIKAYRTDFEYIKQEVLKSRISEIFDLSQIDWEKICEQTVTSNNILIAEYYMEHQDMMMRDMAEHFHISTPTLKNILVRAAQVGLCNYSKDKAFKNGRKHMGMNLIANNDSFTVYSPQNEAIGTFKGIFECCRKLEPLFKDLEISRKKLGTLLYEGETCNGYSFVYDIGLYEHHKSTNPQLFEMCSMFNEGMSVKEISLKINCSTRKVYVNLIAGANMGICNYQKRCERKAV